MKKLIFLLPLLIALFSASAQKEIEPQVNWTESTEQVGDSLKVIFSATINQGIDMYSQHNGATMPMNFDFNDSDSFTKPTNIIESPGPKKKFDKVFEAEVQYYVGTAQFIAMVGLNSTKSFEISGTIDYQICFESGMCILERHEFKIPVNLTK